MAKREILAAAKRKGITFRELYYDPKCPTPGETVPCWEILLTVESENAIYDIDPSLNFNPDLRTTQMVLEWIETLPDIRAELAKEPTP